jgi:hypothetical protein
MSPTEGGGAGARRWEEPPARRRRETFSRLGGEPGVTRPPRGLGGHGADGERETAPRGQPRKGRGQVQDDPAHGALDPHGELDQPLPQRADLGAGAGRALS